MNLPEAIRILTEHNAWRRGAEIPMQSPYLLGAAIDVILLTLNKIQDEKASSPFTIR